jgi:pilus assembly protein CpaF
MNGFEIILPFLKPIEHLILDESISEVMVNGPDHVFVEKAGFLQEVPGVSLGERSLLVAVKNIARRLGDDISEAKPILDSRLPDGSRVAAVIPPCSLGGITLTIRKFSSRHFEMEDLIRAGTLDRSLANRLEDYVLSRKNLLISGSTGSGKTTLAASLGRFIPADERLLLIEDTAEIQLPHPNQVRFEARREQNGLSGIGPTGSSWVKFGAEKLSTSCSFSTPAIPERFPRSTPIPPSRDWLGSPAAFCKAALTSRTVRSKRISPTH